MTRSQLKKRFRDKVMEVFCEACNVKKCTRCRYKPVFWKCGNELVDLVKEMIREEQEQKRSTD